MKKVTIHKEPITLGQLLKYVNIALSGGEVKTLLDTRNILVDGIPENRRGRKLYKGMTIEIEDEGVFKLV